MRLLLAEDDAHLRATLERGLREAGYVVDAVADGEAALAHLAANEYALCVLDWRMGATSGLDVLARMRRRHLATPVLLLTARDEAADRIRGLDEGADDYLVKPFDHGELLARLRALLRRAEGGAEPAIRLGALELDPATRVVTVAGRAVDLTRREHDILEVLLRRRPAVVGRREIALHAWPEEADALGSNTINVHMARLRAKLARSGTRIETVRGLGYRIDA